jgi:hypothetical protein
MTDNARLNTRGGRCCVIRTTPGYLKQWSPSRRSSPNMVLDRFDGPDPLGQSVQAPAWLGTGRRGRPSCWHPSLTSLPHETRPRSSLRSGDDGGGRGRAALIIAPHGLRKTLLSGSYPRWRCCVVWRRVPAQASSRGEGKAKRGHAVRITQQRRAAALGTKVPKIAPNVGYPRQPEAPRPGDRRGASMRAVRPRCVPPRRTPTPPWLAERRGCPRISAAARPVWPSRCPAARARGPRS